MTAKRESSYFTRINLCKGKEKKIVWIWKPAAAGKYYVRTWYMHFSSKNIFFCATCLGFICFVNCAVSMYLYIEAFEQLTSGSVLCVLSTFSSEQAKEWKPKWHFHAKVRRRKLAEIPQNAVPAVKWPVVCCWTCPVLLFFLPHCRFPLATLKSVGAVTHLSVQYLHWRASPHLAKGLCRRPYRCVLYCFPALSQWVQAKLVSYLALLAHFASDLSLESHGSKSSGWPFPPAY